MSTDDRERNDTDEQSTRNPEQTATEGSSTSPVHYWSDGRYTFVADSETIVALHRLAAIAGGADPHRVFGDDNVEVHHQTHRELNLPSTVVALDADYHREVEGSRGLWFEGEDGLPRRKSVGNRDNLMVPVPSDETPSMEIDEAKP